MFSRKRPKGKHDELLLGSHVFHHVGALAVERDSHGRVATHAPQSRYAKAATAKLHRYGEGEFCKFTIPGNYPLEGVYAIISGDRPMYIGECVDLSKRYNAGYGNISPRNCFEDERI